MPKARIIPMLKVKVCVLVMDTQGRWIAKRAKGRSLEDMLREEDIWEKVAFIFGRPSP